MVKNQQLAVVWLDNLTEKARERWKRSPCLRITSVCCLLSWITLLRQSQQLSADINATRTFRKGLSERKDRCSKIAPCSLHSKLTQKQQQTRHPVPSGLKIPQHCTVHSSASCPWDEEIFHKSSKISFLYICKSSLSQLKINSPPLCGKPMCCWNVTLCLSPFAWGIKCWCSSVTWGARSYP